MYAPPTRAVNNVDAMLECSLHMRGSPEPCAVPCSAASCRSARLGAAGSPCRPRGAGDPRPEAPSAGAVPRDESLPAGEEQAKAALEKSLRHGEWADVKLASGDKPIRTFVVYPGRKAKAPIVVVIHEIYGL